MSHNLLEKLMPFNLTQRCIWLRNEWGVNIHKNALSYHYRRLGVRFLTTKYHFTFAGSRSHKLTEQQEFVAQHIDWLRRNKEVIYFDETSVHLWQQKMKVWRTSAYPMNCYLNKIRGHS